MIGQIFNTIFAQPILNLLVGFYKLFLSINLPGAFGWSIIALTIVVRLILQPFFKQQMEMSKKMQEIKPHMDRLNEKHKKDPKKLQEEQMKLYQQHGLNPASGCLFMIVQLPVFYALYGTLSRFLTVNNPSKLIAGINKELYFPFLKIQAINPDFFGINLAVTPSKAAGLYYAIPVITAVLQYFQTQMSMPVAAAPVSPVKDKEEKRGKTEKKTDSGDFQKAMNMQMKYLFPLMIGWFSLNLPVGLALYWNIFSIFTILQYKSINPKSEARNPKQ